MLGSKQTRFAVAVLVCAILTGCVSLGDAPPARPRPQPTAEKATPDLRIPTDTVAQRADIPLVPVPLPPIARSTALPTTPLVRAVSPADAPQPSAAQVVPPTETPPHSARQLLQQAAVRCSSLDSYIVRLTRRENLKDKPQPEEILKFTFRKNPFSVYFKWLGDAAKGREVVYVKGQFESKIHTKVAAGDSMFLPAGATLSLSPDNPLVRSANRHPITDAGIGHCVDTLIALLDAQEGGDRRGGTLRAIAPQRRPEYAKPVETLERIIPPGVEPELPRGGRRLMCFDPDWQLPMLVVTYDDKGREVEYYRYDRLEAPVKLDDHDFNPAELWAPARPGTVPPSRDRPGAKPPSAP